MAQVGFEHGSFHFLIATENTEPKYFIYSVLARPHPCLLPQEKENDTDDFRDLLTYRQCPKGARSTRVWRAPYLSQLTVSFLGTGMIGTLMWRYFLRS
jgi:hypothetical protein